MSDRLTELRAACGYSDGADGSDESDVDSLIAYKDALEDAYALQREMGDFDAAVRAIRAHSDERRREFLAAMLDGVTDMPADATLDALEAAYTEHYDDVWLSDHGTLSDDNDRHQADDYAEGYQAGLRYAVGAMVEHGFVLPPLDAGTYDPAVQGATPDDADEDDEPRDGPDEHDACPIHQEAYRLCGCPVPTGEAAPTSCPRCGSSYSVFYAGRNRCPCGFVYPAEGEA
jgi:hypothetical protein